MATEKIALGINLRKNKVSSTSGFGKYYPEVDTQKTLSLRGFAEHMTAHGGKYSRSEVEGVLNQIVECLPELVAQGVPVQLGALGIFYPTVESVKGGVLNIPAMEGLNPNDIVKGVHIRFQPDMSKLDNLCAPTFKYACRLELRNIVDTVVVGQNAKGQDIKKQTLIPIETAVAQPRIKARWGRMAPLGAPVVPPVKKMAAGSSLSTVTMGAVWSAQSVMAMVLQGTPATASAKSLP